MKTDLLPCVKSDKSNFRGRKTYGSWIVSLYHSSVWWGKLVIHAVSLRVMGQVSDWCWVSLYMMGQVSDSCWVSLCVVGQASFMCYSESKSGVWWGKLVSWLMLNQSLVRTWCKSLLTKYAKVLCVICISHCSRDMLKSGEYWSNSLLKRYIEVWCVHGVSHCSWDSLCQTLVSTGVLCGPTISYMVWKSSVVNLDHSFCLISKLANDCVL